MNTLLSKRGDYVIRCAICLGHAYSQGERRKIREVVSEMRVPKSFAAQVLADLVRADIAASKAGKEGGYCLLRPPDTVTVAELVEAAEGPMVNGGRSSGDHQSHPGACSFQHAWNEATSLWREVLSHTTLADLLARDRALEDGTFPVPADSHRMGGRAVKLEDSVQVELSASQLADVLAAREDLLRHLARAARSDGEAIRVRVGPKVISWLAKTVSVHLGEPRLTGNLLRVSLSWEATGVSGLFPRLAGELMVTAIDPYRSELRLAGRYRPPLGRTGELIDDVLLGNLAKATVRAFLCRVARAAEDMAENVARRS